MKTSEFCAFVAGFVSVMMPIGLFLVTYCDQIAGPAAPLGMLAIISGFVALMAIPLHFGLKE